MAGKQAKVLTDKQLNAIVSHLANNTRLPEKNLALFLLSQKAGLRSCECSKLLWGDCLNSEGEVGEFIYVRDIVSKGDSGGRTIPLNKMLKDALVNLYEVRRGLVDDSWNVIHSQQNSSTSANSITVWFHNLYKDIGIQGASSHSGRRKFLTDVARKISSCGGSIKDVQMLAGHTSVSNTMKYINGSERAKIDVVNLI